MRKPTPLAAAAASAILILPALACRKPVAAPPAATKGDDTDARARAEAEARRRAEEEDRRRREEAERAEAARRTEREAAEALQRAAAAALQDAHFDYDRSDIKADDKPTLQAIADFLRAYPQVTLKIEGHCDERGTVEYNIALGDRRAAAAMSYLVGLGAAQERFSTVSYGKERPLCTEATEGCWSRNRRAHFMLQP